MNTPLNHRGDLRLSDPAGLADGVSITTGVTFGFKSRSTLAVGLVAVVVGFGAWRPRSIMTSRVTGA